MNKQTITILCLLGTTSLFSLSTLPTLALKKPVTPAMARNFYIFVSKCSDENCFGPKISCQIEWQRYWQTRFNSHVFANRNFDDKWMPEYKECARNLIAINEKLSALESELKQTEVCRPCSSRLQDFKAKRGY